MPFPPSDNEKYVYFGHQARWVIVLQFLTFFLVGYNLYRFAMTFPRGELFLGPLVMMTLWLSISFSSGIRRRRVSRAVHDALVAAYAPAQYPRVDVFLPSAGEDIAILHNTYRHVSQLDWAGQLTVYVLDDSARDTVRGAAAAHGFVYLTRPDRGHLKKAGNLKYGFDHSDGDFIAVFDADFVPRPDYLNELIPHFLEGDSTAIVQSPQYFDATGQMRWLERNAAATQEFFYRWVQPARDASRAAICVGTCAVYKRTALDASGGFAQIGHSEDVHTGVNLMKVGYHTKYVPINVSKGICPDNLKAFINQQYRWCSGSMSLLMDANFHRAPFSVRQKVCFWSGFLYYICTGLGVLVLPVPTLLMLAFSPNHIKASNYTLLLIALAIWFFTARVITSKRSNRFVLARISVVYSFAHLLSIIHTVTKRQAAWVPTGAAATTTPMKSKDMPRSVLRLMRGHLRCAAVGTGAGIVVRAGEYGWVHFWAVALLWVFAVIVAGPLLFAGRPDGAAAGRRGRGGPAFRLARGQLIGGVRRAQVPVGEPSSADAGPALVVDEVPASVRVRPYGVSPCAPNQLDRLAVVAAQPGGAACVVPVGPVAVVDSAVADVVGVDHPVEELGVRVGRDDPDEHRQQRGHREGDRDPVFT